jgi:hypothetical protein
MFAGCAVERLQLYPSFSLDGKHFKTDGLTKLEKKLSQYGRRSFFRRCREGHNHKTALSHCSQNSLLHPEQ